MENKKLDNHECVKKWASELRADRSAQYLKSNRKVHLENLMEYFTVHEVSQDDAEFTKRSVVEILVTPTGMTGTKAEHKTWKTNTERDFDDAIQNTYVLGLKDIAIKPLKTAQGYDPDIVGWIKGRFGNHVGPEMIKAAHQPGHTLWMMFMNEFFNRDTGGVL